MGSMGSTDDPERPPPVEETDFLYDRREKELYRVVAISRDGLTLRRGDTEYYVPHRSFAEWYDPDRVDRKSDIPVELPDHPERNAPNEEANKPVSVAQVMEAADHDERIYVRREALRDVERHGTAEYVPVTVEKVWTQGFARVSSSRTRRPSIVDLTDVKLELVS